MTLPYFMDPTRTVWWRLIHQRNNWQMPNTNAKCQLIRSHHLHRSSPETCRLGHLPWSELKCQPGILSCVRLRASVPMQGCHQSYDVTSGGTTGLTRLLAWSHSRAVSPVFGRTIERRQDSGGSVLMRYAGTTHGADAHHES